MSSRSAVPGTETELAALRRELATSRERMQRHPVFSAVQTLQDLRLFMSWHVWAVWDFMSLVKRLQQTCTCTRLPWQPPADAHAARLINEIVLGEESDLAPGGGHCSHYELYLRAMAEVGADSSPVQRFLVALSHDTAPADAMRQVAAPAAVRDFVTSTLGVALHGRPEEVLGSFLHGREAVIPAMFSRLLAEWGLTESQAPAFVFYLRRHIELDGDSHGPAAQALVGKAVGHDPAAERRLLAAGQAAVQQRIALWDALLHELRAVPVKPVLAGAAT
jgi:hypothetical protein